MLEKLSSVILGSDQCPENKVIISCFKNAHNRKAMATIIHSLHCPLLKLTVFFPFGLNPVSAASDTLHTRDGGGH